MNYYKNNQYIYNYNSYNTMNEFEIVRILPSDGRFYESVSR